MKGCKRVKAVALLLGCLMIGGGWLSEAAAQDSDRPIVWRLQSTWPTGNLLHKSIQRLAEDVERMSGGRFRWQVMPAGAIVGAFEVLDAVHRGLIDAAHAWPGYWAGKHPAAGLFGPPPGGPFGLGREEFIAWLFAAGGADLYNELLQKELGLDVVALFTTGLPYWEAFGWVRKPFASLDELRQLKYRTSGLGMEMMQNMGVSVVTLPGAEVLPALERGAVDGAEWAIPSHDILIGFHNVAKYYYMPDLRQPASLQDLLINTSVWEALPDDLKAIVRSACLAEIIRMAATSVDMESKAVAETDRQVRCGDHADAGRCVEGRVGGDGQGVRGGIRQEPFLCQGAGVATRVRGTRCAARKTPAAAPGNTGAALLGRVALFQGRADRRREAGPRPPSEAGNSQPRV